MGRRNADLIREAERHRRSGNSSQLEEAIRLVEASQSECPHPKDAQRVRKGLLFCSECSKVLRRPGERKSPPDPWWERL